jgi:hypothetical protein
MIIEPVEVPVIEPVEMMVIELVEMMVNGCEMKKRKMTG